MTVCIGQLHHITVYRAGFWVCVVLVLGVISLCVPFANSLIEFCFIMIFVTIVGILWPLFFQLQVSAFCNEVFLVLQMHTSLMFPPLYISFEYWRGQVTFGLLFRFSTRIFWRGFPCFATDCSCGVGCRRLSSCILYADPLLGNLIWNDSGFVS